MLPKIWKKLLLAICIIAVLFNITSKFVNRISLEKTISISPEGIDVKEILNIVEEEPITEKSTVSIYNTVADNEIDQQTVSTEEVTDESLTTEEEVVVTEENTDASNEGSMFDITDISDFTTLLY